MSIKIYNVFRQRIGRCRTHTKGETLRQPIFQELQSWAFIITAVAIALAANTVSTKWAQTPHLINQWLVPMLVISPFVFITFGLTAARIGLAEGSAIIDSLLTVSTIMVGLIFFREWSTMSVPNYAGILLVIIGIVLMRWHPPLPSAPLF